MGLRRHVATLGADFASADKKLLVCAAVASLAGGAYVLTTSDLALATSAIAACLCALLGAAGKED